MPQSIFANCLSEKKKASTISGVTKKNTCTMDPRLSSQMSEIWRRAFSVYGPYLWMGLPTHMKNITYFSMFKQCLKTHLFDLRYID